MKIKVLDLFAGTQSVRKALELTGLEFDYIGIDIYSPEEKNTILDLTQDDIVNKLIEVLPIGWKPDFIWASPLCIPFSRAVCIENGTLAVELVNGVLVPRQDFSYITHKAYVEHKDKKEFQDKHRELGRIGITLFENTKEICNYFGVPFAIENPANAMSKYLMKEYFKNDTAYCMYGFKYKKATSIYTHTQLKLKKCNHKRHEQVMSGSPAKTGIAAAPSSNKERSRVPELLIVDIFNQLFNKEQNNENK